MNKPNFWDEAFEETAQAGAKTFDADKFKAKAAIENAKQAAGIGIYSEAELAEQEAEESDDDE